MTGAHHAQYPGIPSRQPVDGNGRSRRRAQRRQQTAADHRGRNAGVGIEQEDRRLVVDDAFRGIAGKVSPGLHAKHFPRPVQPRLEAILPPLAQRLPHHPLPSRRPIYATTTGRSAPRSRMTRQLRAPRRSASSPLHLLERTPL